MKHHILKKSLIALTVFALTGLMIQADVVDMRTLREKARSIKQWPYNEYTDVGYEKPTPWECAQGLCCDGEYFYFAAHHDRTGELSDIHKIRMSDNVEVACFEKQAPRHSPGIDWNEYNDTILACCYGKKLTPCVWELDKNTGKAIGKWDCPEVGHKAGGLIAWEKKNDIILLTSIDDSPHIAFTRMTLLPDGKFKENGTWYYEGPNLGVPQGMDFKNGRVWFLADAGKTVLENPHIIYVLKLNRNKTVSVEKQYRVDFHTETEGLTFDKKGHLYFGSAEEKIYRIDAKYKKMKPWKE